MKYWLCTCIFLFSSLAQANPKYIRIIEKEAENSPIPIDVFLAMTWVESRFNPKALSNKGCKGLMQVHPRTARYMGFRGKNKQLFNPHINVKYGVKYLNYLYRKYKGDLDVALDAYNRGPGNVQKRPYRKDYKKHRYVGKVWRRYNKIAGERLFTEELEKSYMTELIELLSVPTEDNNKERDVSWRSNLPKKTPRI